MNSLYVAKTGLSAQDTKMSTIANNLANANTVGFKRDTTQFTDLMYNIERQPGAQQDAQNELPSGVQIGSGVKVSGTQKVFTTGNFTNTGQDMDLAIAGKGFFQVELANGEIAYTRNGQFSKNSEGLLVNSEGLPLVPGIQIPENAVSISVGNDGLVSAKIAGEAQPEELGQILTVNFVNEAGLEAKGGNLFAQTASSGDPIEGVPSENGLGSIKQGTLEGSNVDVVGSMVALVETQRGYEMNAKVISSVDENMRTLAQNT